MKFTSIMSLVLCIVMLLTLLVSCSSGGGDGVTSSSPETTQAPSVSQTESDSETAEPMTDERGFLKDNLPDKKFNDKVRLFTWSNQIVYEFDSDKETGKPIEDRVFYRKRHLKDTYGIELDIDLISCTPGNTKTFMLALSTVQNENGDNFDVVGAPMFVAGSAASKGYFEDLSDKSYAPYIDLSKPWWNDAVIEEAKLGGRVYTVTGDITPTFYRGLSVCVVNNNLWGDLYDPGDVCQLVKNKEWTYDKLIEIAADAATLNDGVIPVSLDSEEMLDGIFTSAGFSFLELTDKGDVALCELSKDNRFLDFYKFSYDAMKSDAVALSSHTEAIVKGKALVHFGTCAQIEYIFENGLYDYRIAPYPMHATGEQSEYKSGLGLSTTFYGIAVCADNELASFTLEALASYGYRWLTPAWAEVAINGRPEIEHFEMLELVRKSITLELGYTFSDNLEYIGMLGNALKETPDWTAYTGGKITDWNAAIKEINSKLG